MSTVSSCVRTLLVVPYQQTPPPQVFPVFITYTVGFNTRWSIHDGRCSIMGFNNVFDRFWADGFPDDKICYEDVKE